MSSSASPPPKSPADPILLVPGEDPFFFATGRTPAYPVLLFDPATFPYSPAQAADTPRSTGIRWLILKRDLQLAASPCDQLPAITAALQDGLVPYRRLAVYDVYPCANRQSRCSRKGLSSPAQTCQRGNPNKIGHLHPKNS